MKLPHSMLDYRVLAAVAVAAMAWVVVQAAQPAGGDVPDVFRVGNQARNDPFSEQYKAPEFNWKADDAQISKGKSPKPKALPQAIIGPDDLIDFYVKVSPEEVKRGQIARVTVTGVPRENCYTYAMTKKGEDQRPPALAVFKASAIQGLQPLGPIEESPEPVVDAKTGYFEQKQAFTWSFDLLVNADAKPGPAELPMALTLQVCKAESCVPGTIHIKALFSVQKGDPVAITEELKTRAAQKFPPEARLVVPENTPNKAKIVLPAEAPAAVAAIPKDYSESIDRIRKQIQAPDTKPLEGLVMFMLTGMFWGFVSLITPCVFPMIPITVSFFLKQSEKEHHRPVSMALVYCGTIIVVLTIAAAALLNFFRVLSISPVMNFGLGLLFVFFALSLFGMFDIELPSFLARYTSEREGRGGMVGTVFMALTFTIISFACVAPFLGGFGGTANTATRPFLHTLLGGLAFSTTFAAPFFILALFPTLLKAIPKSGAWLNSVKVVMGFLELAAALKFFRAGELVLASPLGLFTFDLVLGLWIGLCGLCGLYLLGLYRLPLDSPVEHLSVPRMLFAFTFLGLGLYLMPALFVKATEGEQPRPSGVIYAWVSSFLLSDPPAGAGGEMWSPNLESAIAQAREFRQRTGKAKLVFIDFTGEVCNNCRLNENNVFSKGEIQKLFKPYALVKLYCDTIPLKYYASQDRAAAEGGRRSTDAEINHKFQVDIFNGAELPLYVILDPLPDGTVKVVARFDEGLIRSEQHFAEFLRKPLETVGAALAAR